MARSSKSKKAPAKDTVEHALTLTETKTHAVLATEERLYERVVSILENARGHVSRSVNSVMVHAYWQIGREIIEVEQHGSARANYGEQVIERLSTRLTAEYQKGLGERLLRRMRQFYLTYPHGSSVSAEPKAGPRKDAALHGSDSDVPIWSAARTGFGAVLFPPSLGWTHYRVLLSVPNPLARAFYEIEAARENWAARELERQIGALLFERLAKNRDKEKVMALAREGQQVDTPADVLKDPLVLEFLDLKEQPAWQERDLEQAIINRLEDFLLELGRGFCFVARQKRITIDGDHFYVDLVFYNRLLRAFVLLDLKLAKLTPQDLGQMLIYVNYFDRYQRTEHEAPTIGIVLCSDKNDAMVKIAFPKEQEQVMAARYQLYLPTEEELRTELTRERQEAERRLQDINTNV